jgi:excisionase family DNA binding protein
MTSPAKRDLAELPAVLNVEQAAEVLGLSRTAAYELIRTGTWPTPVFRLGRLIRIPTAPVLRLLGVASEDAATGQPSPSREAAG